MAVVRNESDVQKEGVARSSRTYMQWLIDRRDGVPNFELRKFIIEPGGEIPPHMHEEIEHEQYVLKGSYLVVIDGKEYRVKPGDSIYIPAGRIHSYRNDGPEPAEFLCIVPKKQEYKIIWVEEERASGARPSPRC